MQSITASLRRAGKGVRLLIGNGAACEAVICWLEVFRKTSSIRNGPKLAAFPAYLGALAGQPGLHPATKVRSVFRAHARG
jgi:hypothetical protein